MPDQTVKQESDNNKKESVTEQPQKTATVKQRIDSVIDVNFQDKDELKKQMFKLVQHILYPEQFCPDCDERMFMDSTGLYYNCANCGYQSPKMASALLRSNTHNPQNSPEVQRGAVPPQVEKAIAAAEEAMKDVRIPTKTTPLGDKIRKLVNDRDAGGPSAPTKDDENRVKNSSSNVSSKINWV